MEHAEREPQAGSWIRAVRVRRVAAAMAVVAALAATAQWIASTCTADAIAGPGIGFEGAGVGPRLSIGDHAVFMGFFAGRSPHSQATITGYSLPHIPGVHLALYTVTRPPWGSPIGTPTVTGYRRNAAPSYPLAPLVGRRLGPAPRWLHTRDPVLMVALVATVLRRGCTHIDGVKIRYRVGDTTFTRGMQGIDYVSTTDRRC